MCDTKAVTTASQNKTYEKVINHLEFSSEQEKTPSYEHTTQNLFLAVFSDLTAANDGKLNFMATFLKQLKFYEGVRKSFCTRIRTTS